MPDASSINATSAASTAAGSSRAGGFSALSADEFTKIIFAELSRQDPLQPNDTNALLQQISTIRSIQSDMDLSTRLGQVVKQNEFASASSLVGKFVGGLDENRERVSGQVRSVSRTAEGVTLELLGGVRVPMSDLDEIREPESTEEPR